MKIVLGFLAFLLLLIPVTLRELSLDYFLAFGMCAIAGVGIFIRRRILISAIDAGWLVSFLTASFYLIHSLGHGASAETVATQSLLFFMPIISLAARSKEFSCSIEFMGKLAIWMCAIKLLSYIPYLDLYFSSITSRDERIRFQDYSSTIVVFFLFAILLNKGVYGYRKLIFIAGTALVLALGVAHRSLYVALIAQLIYALSIGSTKIFKRVFAAILIGGVLTLLSPAGKVMLNLFEASFAGTDSNTSARINLSKSVFLAGFDYPFGHGFGGVFEFGSDSRGEEVYYALQHNSFLSYLYYLGWPSFIAALAGFGLLLVRKNATTPQLRIYKSMIIGMLTFAYFNMFLEHPIYGFFFWVVIGLFINQLRNNSEPRRSNLRLPTHNTTSTVID